MGDWVMTNKLKQLPYKKILILENEYWDANQGNDAYRFYTQLEENGVEFKIIERAAHAATNKEIVDAMLWCDAILFASTFFYSWDVKGVGDLLMNVPVPKTVIGYVMGVNPLLYHLTTIWKLEELSKMSHHKVFELVKCHLYDDEDDDEMLTEIDMLQFKTAWDKEVAELIEFNHSFKSTGKKIKIGTLRAVGEQWSLLKEGDIVDELECSTIDPNPARGTWVMGKDEPVKLVNDSGYEEYQYEELTAENLTLEFFSRGGRKDLVDVMETVESWIYHALGKILLEEGGDIELWEWCDTLCKTIGVERRGNRHYFEKRLKEYNKAHKFFKEPTNDPKDRMMARNAAKKRIRKEGNSRIKLVRQNPSK